MPAASAGFTLVEPCCGSASLTLHLLGARRPLLPYQGSKWRFRHALGEVVERLGFAGRPARVVLEDVSAWGVVMGAVLSPEVRGRVVRHLRDLGAKDARAVYDALNGSPTSEDVAALAAEFLFLQRLSFSGKAVGIRAARWSSPGFNVSSAYGLPATDRFGAVSPMIPSLVAVLEGYDALSHAVVDAHHGPARVPPARVDGPTLVYLDPPYAGSTAYPDGSLSPQQVVALARAWRAAGASVMVSEGCPIEALREEGWACDRVNAGRGDTSPFRGKQEEWVTSWHAPRGGARHG